MCLHNANSTTKKYISRKSRSLGYFVFFHLIVIIAMVMVIAMIIIIVNYVFINNDIAPIITSPIVAISSN